MTATDYRDTTSEPRRVKTSLPPELRRRFTLGTFFFDLPLREERKAIWDIYFKNWNLTRLRSGMDPSFL